MTAGTRSKCTKFYHFYEEHRENEAAGARSQEMDMVETGTEGGTEKS